MFTLDLTERRTLILHTTTTLCARQQPDITTPSAHCADTALSIRQLLDNATPSRLCRVAKSPPILRPYNTTRDHWPSMTAVHSRAPLEVLSMSAAQRPSRRKTMRQFFDDDEEPPAKRSRVEPVAVSNATSKQIPGKSAAAKAKKARTGALSGL